MLRVARHSFRARFSTLHYRCTVELLLPHNKCAKSIVVGTFTLPRRTSPSAHSEFSGALEMGEGGEGEYIGSKGRGGNLV